MNQKKVYYKSDFKVFLESEAGWTGLPFRLKFYTGAPTRAFWACFDGTNYENCHLHEDGRLCVAFDNHNFGFGTLRMEPTFYLNDACYRDGICDEAIPPFDVVLKDAPTEEVPEPEEYTIVLAMDGVKTLETIGTLPAFYQKGDTGDPGLTPEEHDALIDATNRANTAAEGAEDAINHAEEAAADAEAKAAIAAEAARNANAAREHIDQRDAEITEAEASRNAREAGRISNEIDRQNREAGRISNENARQNREAVRISNENARHSNENARVSAEAARASAELRREERIDLAVAHADTAAGNASAAARNANAAREHIDQRDAEITEAEASRNAREAGRISNEIDRQNREAGRISNENARQNREAVRISNENARHSNENARVSAEAARASAELRREERINLAVAHADTAAGNASAAAGNANAAATQAGNVNAVLDGDNLTVTDRNGQSVTRNVRGPKGDSITMFPNVTIFGQPTIQESQISGFTAQNYVQFPFLVDFAGRPWQLDCSITTGADVSQQHNIFDSAFGLAFAFSGGKFVLAMSSNGTSWNLGATSGTHNILPNTTYYIRISWDGTRYVLAYSTNKETWVDDIVVTSSASLASKQIVIGKSLDNRYIFNGSINMSDAHLTISGKIVWEGMDDAGLATRMAIDLSNIDEEGKARVNEVAMAGEVGQKLNDLSSQLDDKLSIGGRDDSARVGFANNLIGVPYREENAEFFSRKTGGLAEVVDGSATIKSIKGSSVVWNQWMKNSNYAEGLTGWLRLNSTLTINPDGSILVVNTNDNTSWGVYQDTILKKSKYLIVVDMKRTTPTTANMLFYMQKVSGGADTYFSANFASNNREIHTTIINTTDDINRVSIYPCRLGNESCTIYSIRVYDLTQLFGAGNEPTTYEAFLLRKPQVADEYAYNEGEIVSANIAKYKSHNADGTKEFVRELPDDSVFFDDVLPSGKVVKGMKGAGNAFDERTEKQRIKRIGVFENLGKLQWNYDASRKVFYAISNWLFENISSTNIIDSIGHNGADWVYTQRKTNYITIGWYLVKGIHISDYRYSDAASFKAAMQGVLLYYELAEPIVEYVEAANLSVNVWHNGTEEVIAKDGTPSTPLKATIDYDLDYPAQVKSLMQLHTETAALLQQLKSQVLTQSNE